MIDAVPYLLGFHPYESAVLIGIDGAGRVTIVARMDVADIVADRKHEAAEPHVVRFTPSAVQTLVRSGASSAMPLLYSAFVDDLTPDCPGLSDIATTAGRLAHRASPAELMDAVSEVEDSCDEVGLDLSPWVLVGASQWASMPAGSRSLIEGPVRRSSASPVAAEATYAGLVARPDRESLVELLAPRPAAQRDRLLPGLGAARNRARSLGSSSAGQRARRSQVRRLFAATRALPVLDDDTRIAFGAALNDIEVRDSCWLAIERGDIDGEALWQELACSLPDAYAAAPLFLFGWRRWRDGDGALAVVAVTRALRCEPDYRAAHLLDSALQHGLDPFRTPRLRKSA